MTPLEYGQALIDLSHSIFVPTTDSELSVCRLCRGTVGGRERHIETNHGDEFHHDHDPRFGNMIAWKIKENTKRRRAFNKSRKAA
jgi:hypothetical protein